MRVPLTNDAGVEGLEQFFVNLSGPVNATLADAQATVFIVDDDTAGIEVLSFGTSDDVYPIDLGTDQIVENPGGGLDLANASVSYTLPEKVENLQLTEIANIYGTGNALVNMVTGNTGDNTLVGADGNDTLTGAGGGDLMQGGQGDDVYDVNHGDDDVVENCRAPARSWRCTISYTLVDDAENLLLQGSANLNGAGNQLPNQITGNSGANRLVGDDAADTLSGAAATTRWTAAPAPTCSRAARAMTCTSSSMPRTPRQRRSTRATTPCARASPGRWRRTSRSSS